MGVSFDKIDGVIWYDGKLVKWGDANVHVLTHGLHYASCVFEGERAYGGVIFKSTEHSERLKRSANILDFEIPYSIAEIDAAKALVIEKNNRPNAYVRPVAWRGSEMMGVSAQNNTIHLAIAACSLAGITRSTAIDLAQRRGIEVIERRIMPEELNGFSECFITGTAAEVTAVSEIADWRFTPGKITQALMADYTTEVQPKGKKAAALNSPSVGGKPAGPYDLRLL